MGILNPLTQDHVDAINRVLRSATDIKDTIDACEECGLDMTDRRGRHEAQQQIATQIKKIFMPHLP